MASTDTITPTDIEFNAIIVGEGTGEPPSVESDAEATRRGYDTISGRFFGS